MDAQKPIPTTIELSPEIREIMSQLKQKNGTPFRFIVERAVREFDENQRAGSKPA